MKLKKNNKWDNWYKKPKFNYMVLNRLYQYPNKKVQLQSMKEKQKNEEEKKEDPIRKKEKWITVTLCREEEVTK